MEREAKEKLLLRLRSIEGHIGGIQRMVEEDRSCLDVVRQTLAVKRALDRVSRLLVASHLRACLGGQAGWERAAAAPLEELLELLDLTGRM